jgi:hypothetical protein
MGLVFPVLQTVVSAQDSINRSAFNADMGISLILTMLARHAAQDAKLARLLDAPHAPLDLI